MKTAGREKGEAGAEPRCVVWHLAEKGVPADLARSLERRGLSVQVATNPYDAMARVCKRGQRIRDAVILLLIEPSRLRRAPDVVRALRKAAPRAVFWGYHDASSPRLRAVEESDLQSWDRSVDQTIPVQTRRVDIKQTLAQPERVQATTPRLRLAGDKLDRIVPDGEGSPITTSIRTEKSGGSLLTQDELAMLLADEVEWDPDVAPHLGKDVEKGGGRSTH